MFLDHLVLPAFVVTVPAMVVFLATNRHFPRVAGVASSLMALGLGIMFLWAAVTMIITGTARGDSVSRIMKTTLQRSESPVEFWTRVAFFGVPALLLIGAPIAILADFLYSRFFRRDRPSERRP